MAGLAVNTLQSGMLGMGEDQIVVGGDHRLDIVRFRMAELTLLIDLFPVARVAALVRGPKGIGGLYTGPCGRMTVNAGCADFRVGLVREKNVGSGCLRLRRLRSLSSPLQP
jgi:hypothetical protein